ncbi:amino acid adenylation domain-containing protein [Streptomyces alboflavus]|uniref:amino acid adenylation domain-containing protein n=1 Tax=Streptomyces alboflavus TaxID=67267 RepID=UPI0036AD4FE3
MGAEARSTDTADAYVPLHVRVEAQAELTPSAVAVVDGAETYTYAELEARAALLAHRLRELGAAPEAAIGVCLPRGIELIVSLLAVWKSGAAYVPLDPEHPWERSAWVLKDTAADLVIVDDALAARVSDTGARPVAPTCAAGPDSPAGPAQDVPGEQAAYVLYTSGSTGRPKGVVVSHAGIANRVSWVVRRHGLGPADRVLQKTTLTFDAACWEVFAPLVSGGTVVLAPPGAEADASMLLRAVAAHEVSVLQVVPSMLRILADEPGWADCTALRLLFSAGEPLHAELVQSVIARRDVEVWNTYGPTECSIDITAHRFDPAQQHGPVPIGRPIPGMRVLVADSGGRPVSVGTRGELYAGGVGVARGYLGQPERTAEGFVPDPYATDGSRLYRTGDLVRWSADGTLEYLGRADDQVKVNGVRVEPGEVEAALVAHPDVRGAVVKAFTRDGTTRLVGYVHRRDAGEGQRADTDLRDFLRTRLPGSHVPTVVVELDRFPLTPSGKVDRLALPEPAPDADQDITAPRTEAERLVARVWQDLLGGDDFGVNSDFFRLGGTSLQLTRLANRLRSVSGREVRLRDLLTATTVEAQALLITGYAEDADVIPKAARPASGSGAPGGLQVSYGQRRLWFLDRMNPGSPEWVSVLPLRVPADASDDLVRRALDALVARHEALRTRFAMVDGEPMQFVMEPGAQELTVVDTDRDKLHQLLAADAERGFDLETGPVLRALLARVPAGQGESVLSLTIHHIACDGWSSAILDRDFHELLASEMSGRPCRLAPPRLQYADYAAWQRTAEDGASTEREIQHWVSVLDGVEPLPLPTDRPRPPVRDGRGGIVAFTLPASLTEAFEELGRQHGATPYETLLTAFATLLGRYTDQWDTPIGTPVAGRDREETEEIVGFFLNSLVIRCRPHADLGFDRALDHVRGVFREALAHQTLPFERLVAELDAEGDLARTPLYQVAFDLHDEELTGSAALADFHALEGAWRVAKTDLSLFMRRVADGRMIGGFEYATALFDRTTVERLAQHFVRVVEAVTARPDLPLEQLPVLSSHEIDRLSEWSRNPGPRPHACPFEVFERWAAATPDAIAVTSDGADITYRGLDERANAVAHRLRALGVGPEDVVGVLLDRGPDLLAALLAVWKAGGAYLPLDPSHPAGRMKAVLADAGARVLVLDSGGRDRIGRPPGIRLLLTDAATESAVTTAPDRTPDLDRLAYVIYTSGSTGRPKGVQITHAGLANHLVWAAAELAGQAEGGAPVFSSIAFDLVVPNLWAPLMAGRTVTLLPQDLDLSTLGRLLEEAGPFAFVKMTPAHLEILSEQLSAEQVRALASVYVVAGEALPGRLVDRWAAPVINEYGPTEASVGTCVFPAPDHGNREIVPIGRPLPNMTMRVLDQRLQPVPVGVTGELYVGGAGVARGYVGQPAQTAAAFLPDPCGASGDRMYRTGDLVRLLPGGDVDFLGRIDHQVKIRGHRIETTEIQLVLAEHPRVREAVVTVRESGPGDRSLVAHYVAVGDTPPTHDDFVTHCTDRLPSYMVPSAFMALPALPLNANGKVDRTALAALELRGEPDVVAPRTVAEERIAEIWTDLLGRDVGVHGNFFHTGGNSILAIRLVASLQDAFEIELPIRAVFEGPTVAELATAIEKLIRAEFEALSDDELIAQSQPFGE